MGEEAAEEHDIVRSTVKNVVARDALSALIVYTLYPS
jgi:hypothetical protein